MAVSARHIRQQARKREVFLAALAAGNSVSDAAKKAAVDRTTVYRWRAEDPQLAQDWDDAWMQRADLLEQTAFERAVIGWDEPAVSAGKWVHDDNGKPLMIRKFDHHLLETLLKGAKPTVYRENIKVTGSLEHSLIPSASSSQLLDKLAEQLDPATRDAVAQAFLTLAGDHVVPALPAGVVDAEESEGADDEW